MVFPGQLSCRFVQIKVSSKFHVNTKSVGLLRPLYDFDNVSSENRFESNQKASTGFKKIASLLQNSILSC